ncbi:MAG: S8 family serine peptidase [Blastocatellia bacterium]
MANQDQKKNRHFILEGFADREKFQRPKRKIEKESIPEQDRTQHGNALLLQVEALKPEMETARADQEEAGLDGGFGLQVEFESFPDIELAFESLAQERSGIELFNVRHDDHSTYATVFVPDGKLDRFERLIQDYLKEKRDSAGRVRDHKALVNAIQQIRAASLRALWTDDPAVFPAQDDEMFWWEVWLPIRGDRAATVGLFRRLTEARGMATARGQLEFPERTVLLVRTSAEEMQRSMMTLNSIAELRRGKETAAFFDSLPAEEQSQWLNELIQRARFPGPDEDVPYVCVLDTGVNRGHPLVAPALADNDLHAVEPAWGAEDASGHGTQMAGLALIGDLGEALDSSHTIAIGHRLESVKLLPADGGNEGDAKHHGYLTTEAVARP